MGTATLVFFVSVFVFSNLSLLPRCHCQLFPSLLAWKSFGLSGAKQKGCQRSDVVRLGGCEEKQRLAKTNDARPRAEWASRRLSQPVFFYFGFFCKIKKDNQAWRHPRSLKSHCLRDRGWHLSGLDQEFLHLSFSLFSHLRFSIKENKNADKEKKEKTNIEITCPFQALA